MCTPARLACVLTLLAAPAAAQSSTEDGIRAVLRGEYQAAVRILRPLADDAARQRVARAGHARTGGESVAVLRHPAVHSDRGAVHRRGGPMCS